MHELGSYVTNHLFTQYIHTERERERERERRQFASG